VLVHVKVKKASSKYSFAHLKLFLESSGMNLRTCTCHMFSNLGLNNVTKVRAWSILCMTSIYFGIRPSSAAEPP